MNKYIELNMIRWLKRISLWWHRNISIARFKEILSLFSPISPQLTVAALIFLGGFIATELFIAPQDFTICTDRELLLYNIYLDSDVVNGTNENNTTIRAESTHGLWMRRYRHPIFIYFNNSTEIHEGAIIVEAKTPEIYTKDYLPLELIPLQFFSDKFSDKPSNSNLSIKIDPTKIKNLNKTKKKKFDIEIIGRSGAGVESGGQKPERSCWITLQLNCISKEPTEKIVSLSALNESSPKVNESSK